jgi:hypothetical protein
VSQHDDIVSLRPSGAFVLSLNEGYPSARRRAHRGFTNLTTVKEDIRSYLDSRPNDFAEPIEEACRLDFTDVPLVDPANDNEPTRVRLSRSRVLLHRLMANLRVL